MIRPLIGIALTVKHNEASRDAVSPRGVEVDSQIAQKAIELVDGQGPQQPHDNSWRTIFGKSALSDPDQIRKALKRYPIFDNYTVTFEQRTDGHLGVNLEYSLR